MILTPSKVISLNSFSNPLIIEFLRSIYCDAVQLDETRAMNLLLFAEKYLEKDLKITCFEFLTRNLTSENVFRILDFASQQNEKKLWDSGISFLKENLDGCDLSELIKYLDKPQESEFAKSLCDLEDSTVKFVIQQYSELYQKEPAKIQIFEDFLIKNVNMKTIALISNFVQEWGWHQENVLKNSDPVKETREAEKTGMNLRKTVFEWVNKNMKEIQEKNYAQNIPKKFWEEFEEENLKNENSIKEKEAVQENHSEESQELKETK